MSKILKATCEEGVVKVGSLVVDAEILTQGTRPSEGILVLEEGETPRYFATNTVDIEDLLETIADALSSIATALSSLDAKPVGGSGSAPAPSVAGNVSTINTKASDLTTLKGNLK